jgi:chemotaxis protein histidine kinase CheA
VPGIAAATIFGNGKVALILDVEKLSELSAESMMPGNAAQPAVVSTTAH